jgi:NAD(P)-dependent dehydrogenase (short-subunit alcohol dehydrogenase family)
MADWLENRVAIVTGSGRGIGRAIAILMAGEGARVVVNDLGCQLDGGGSSNEPANSVVEEIKQLGGEAVSNYESVATMEGARNIVQCAIDNFSRIDILVNNAAITYQELFIDTSAEDFNTVIDINLKGPFNCLQAVLPYMISQKYGRILNISSGSALGLVRGEVAYGATKAGVLCFTKGIALEVKEYGITVNAVMPIAKTRMQEVSKAKIDAGIVKAPPGIARNQAPETIAPLVVYLAGERAGRITGRTFSRRFLGTIQVLSEPTPVRAVYKDEGWTVEEIDKVMPQLIPEIE